MAFAVKRPSLDGVPIPLADIGSIGAGLVRPECVLAHASGLLIVPDWTAGGGVALVAPDGRVGRVLSRGHPVPLRPNGIALEPGGSLLLAHLGESEGGLFRLHPDGTVEAVLTQLEGRPIPPSNFPLRAADGTIWLTVSTRAIPRALGYRPGVKDGFIVRIDGAGARIAADGLGYTNEVAVSADGTQLFVNETFARRLSAYRIGRDGTLSGRRVVSTFEAGTFPDGLALDVDGALWVTSIVSNRVIRIHPDGRQEVVIEDCAPRHLQDVEAAFLAGTMGRPHLDHVASRKLRNISSLAFAGADLTTGVLGCLLGDHLATFRAPVAGLRPPHWTFDIDALIAAAAWA